MTDWAAEIRRRLERLSLRPEREAEIIEELTQHLRDQVRERIAGGKAERDATHEALAELDVPGVLAARLAETEARLPLNPPAPGAPARGRWFSQFAQDVRLALRVLRRRPWFSVSVLAALAFTIGPTTAVVSVGNWLLWTPSPAVVEPHRLVVIWSGTWQGTGSVSPSGVSYLNLDELRRTSSTLSSIAGWQESTTSLAVPGTKPRTAQAGFVTVNFFDVLGLRLAAGRPFTQEEDQPPFGEPVTIVSHGLATSAFGSPEAAIDQRIHVNGRPMTIVGVGPRGFTGASPISQVDVWYTGGAYAYVHRFDDAFAARYVSRTDGLFYTFIGRLAPERTAAEAQAELDTLVPLLAEHHPGVNDKFKTVRARVYAGLGPQELSRPMLERQLKGLLIVAGVLLVLGCANVSNLLLAEGTRTHRERAIRLALGASHGRLVRQQLTESVVLALLGAAVGIGLAVGLKHVIQVGLFPGLSTAEVPPVVPIDRFVLLTTTAAAVACGILAGLAPAWIGTRLSLRGTLSSAGGRSVTGAPRVRAGLAAVQLALSLALITGAALMIVTLRQLSHVDLGFDKDGVVSQWVSASVHGYTPERTLVYNQQLREKLAADPAFESVSIATGHPFAYSFRTRVNPPPGRGQEVVSVRQVATDDRFAPLLKLRMMHGRYFEPSEVFAAELADGHPVVVSAALARTLFGREAVLGERVQLARTALNPVTDLVVVGVAADTATSSLKAPPDPVMYVPITQRDLETQSVLLIRTRGTMAGVTAAVERATAELDPTLPQGAARALSAWIDRGIASTQLYARMLSLLGGIAVLLASVGLYGLLTQAVGERRREFGVRLAIGATGTHIARLVVRQAAWIAGLGIAGGVVLSYWGTGLISGYLWGVAATDPRVYALTIAALLFVVALAAARPAWAATRVNPIETLRAE